MENEAQKSPSHWPGRVRSFAGIFCDSDSSLVFIFRRGVLHVIAGSAWTLCLAARGPSPQNYPSQFRMEVWASCDSGRDAKSSKPNIPKLIYTSVGRPHPPTPLP